MEFQIGDDIKVDEEIRRVIFTWENGLVLCDDRSIIHSDDATLHESKHHMRNLNEFDGVEKDVIKKCSNVSKRKEIFDSLKVEHKSSDIESAFKKLLKNGYVYQIVNNTYYSDINDKNEAKKVY